MGAQPQRTHAGDQAYDAPAPSGSAVCTFTLVWYSRFSRLKAAIRNLANDPHAQGQAAKVAGIALVADGFIGLENPLDGKRSRNGIFGTLFLIVFGAAFHQKVCT